MQFLQKTNLFPTFPRCHLNKGFPQGKQLPTKLHTACADPQVSSFRFQPKVFFPPQKQTIPGWFFIFCMEKKTWKKMETIVLEVQRIQNNKCFILSIWRISLCVQNLISSPSGAFFDVSMRIYTYLGKQRQQQRITGELYIYNSQLTHLALARNLRSCYCKHRCICERVCSDAANSMKGKTHWLLT